MKTAGKDFLDWYNQYVKDNGCSPSDYDVNFYWTNGNSEKEKQQIIDAFKSGECMLRKPEQYYSETFKND